MTTDEPLAHKIGASEPPAYKVGATVRVRGLAGRTELNGRCGVVTFFDAETGRNSVKIAGETKPVALRPRNLEAVRPPSLSDLGYDYVRGPSEDPDDWVLRQTQNPILGFEWRGQTNYDEVGAAVVAWIRARLVDKCGLRALPCKGGAVAYASPDLGESSSPLLMLVCGSAPGGDAGVWGRALCINDTTLSGSMFSYVRRAQGLGWSVLIADPHGGDGFPHAHLAQLWKSTIGPCAASRVLIVAHSYGAAVAASLLKFDVAVRRRVAALAMTDGMVFRLGEGWTRSTDALLDERVPTEREALSEPGGEGLREMLSHYAEAAPHAFEMNVGRWQGESPRAVLAAVGRNFVCSELELGSTVSAKEGEAVAVSSGSDAHPSSTRAAEPAVFAFLEKGAAGEAKADNDKVRAGKPSWPPAPPKRWKRSVSMADLKPVSVAGSLAAVTCGTCVLACVRLLMWAIFGGQAKVTHM